MTKPAWACARRSGAAWLRGGAGDLRVQADVVERTGGDRQRYRRSLGTAQVGRTVIAALAGRGSADDQPQEQDHCPLAHISSAGQGHKPSYMLLAIVAFPTPLAASPRRQLRPGTLGQHACQWRGRGGCLDL